MVQQELKILALYGNQVYYGHERSNIQVFNTLNDHDVDFLVLVNEKGLAPQAKRVLNHKKIAYRGILFPDWSDMRKPFTFMKTLSYIWKVWQHNRVFLKQHKKFKPDYIYIANDFMYINLIPSLMLINTKVVYRLGDAPVLSFKVFKILWKYFIVKRTFKFVCISEYILEKLRAVGRDPNFNDKVIYNFPPERIEKDLAPIAFRKTEVVFSYLGQIIQIKGVHEFVNAAISVCKKYDHVSFMLAGNLDKDKSFAESQLLKVKSSGLEDRIVFLGGIENLRDFFSKTDVLVTPSIKEEPLGNVLVEAKAHHTPSIIFKSGGMPELITHKVNGFVCSEKTAFGLERAMLYYLKHPEKIQMHSDEAKRSIKSLGIDYENYESNWIEVFKNK